MESKKPYSNKKSLLLLMGISMLLITFVLVQGGLLVTGVKLDAILTVSFFAAFFGGFLSLIAPCSAAMLPVFFAYSFQQKRQLVFMTLVFYLGLATIFVPLGFASSAISQAFVERPDILYNGAGIIFLIFGTMLLFGKSFQILPRQLRIRAQGTSIMTVYIMGMLFAFASGTCAAPIIGGIFTIAATTGNTVTAVLLLLTYALGMVGPMFIMAWLFDRYNFSASKLVQGTELHLSVGRRTLTFHSTNIISGALFIIVGILFIVSKGTNAFLGLFSQAGITDLYYRANIALLELSRGIPIGITAVLMISAVTYFIITARKSNMKKHHDYQHTTDKDA